MSKKFDSIIVGQGLAGSILAFRLIQHGQRVVVIDNNHYGSSSKVAAGIINPITGYRLITNILFSRQRETALCLYKELEDLFSRRFVTELKQFRLLKSEEQAKFWLKRQQHTTYQNYAGRSLTRLEPFIDNDWGVVEIHKTLRIHTSELLHAFKKWLIEKNSYISQKIAYQSIEAADKKIKISDIESKNIIFCEGFQAIHNPWWKHLPFKLSKGEILKIELNQSINCMLNWRQWLIPELNKDSKALLGANYEWGDFSTDESLNPNQDAQDYLLMRLKTNTTLSAKVIQQHTGIRPTPTHRYPYIGPHKNNKNVFCFNGFGSKGCLTIPYYSDLLTQHLTDNTSLPEDVTRWL